MPPNLALQSACRLRDSKLSRTGRAVSPWRTQVFANFEVPPMERAIPILPGNDLRVAKQFYVDGLGFRVRFEATEDGKSGLLGLERGTLCLTIDCPMSGHGRDACVCLEVESADAYYAEWQRRVAVKRAPQDESWGAR